MYIYIYAGESFVCPPLAFARVIRLSTVLWKFHSYSGQKQIESHWFGHRIVISLSTFWVHFCPQKVDKLMTLEVAKLMTFKWLYVFSYLGLFGPFFWKTRTLIEKQTGTSGDKLITFWNVLCRFSVFWEGLLFFYFPVVFFLLFLCSLLMFLSLLLRIYLC